MRIEILPVLDDNYVFILVDETSLEAIAIDPGVATPVLEFVAEYDLKLLSIWLTHHHADHTAGVVKIRDKTGCKVFGSILDQERLPKLDLALAGGDTFSLWDQKVKVLDTPGHTLGAVSYHLPDFPALFCGDTLFSMGCGRLFEGTPQQMYASLQAFGSLDPETAVFCAHEYTEKNGEFALSIEPENTALKERMFRVRALRRLGQPTIPVSLKEELRTNPFLRTGDPKLLHKFGVTEEWEMLAKLRLMKDQW